MKIISLSRQEYLDSVQQLDNFENLKFLKTALDTWDNYYSWVKNPPLCLQIEEEDVCYLFYHISKDNEYLTIHNVLTPSHFRQKGYAYTLLAHLFEMLKSEDIKRCKLHSVHNSIPFYNRLGLHYWGVNENGLYYSDFIMPKDITQIGSINQNSSLDEFSHTKLLKMYQELSSNAKTFDEKQQAQHEVCLKLMQNRFKFKLLEERLKEKNLI